jgi:hypothetical protein
MNARILLGLFVIPVLLLAFLVSSPTPACCPAPPSGKPVLNADQTVIIIWDAAKKTQHFIRQATFKSAADNFGFLVPTPTQPELEESGNEAFPFLRKLTEPATRKMARPSNTGCYNGCSAPPGSGAKLAVNILAEKLVAGFQSVVLEAESANGLIRWLKDHGYAFSPEVEQWVRPYVAAKWKITALKVAKGKESKERSVDGSALRMSFKIDRPVFPYREPNPEEAVNFLGNRRRLLRIYFLGEARYRGDLTKDVPWTGKIAWANKLSAEDRKKVLGLLKLPETTGPAEWWLTEFEHDWPYRLAPADVYFARDADQNPVQREPIIEYTSSLWPTDVTVYAIAAVLLLPPLSRRFSRGRRAAPPS